MEILEKILSAVLIATLPIMTGFFCDFLRKLAQEAKVRAKTEQIQALIEEIDKAVETAVIYVNQTFVDELKKANTFAEDPEYAHEAFRTAYSTTLEILSEDAQTFIEKTFGNIEDYLAVKIEESVHNEKNRH